MKRSGTMREALELGEVRDKGARTAAYYNCFWRATHRRGFGARLQAPTSRARAHGDEGSKQPNWTAGQRRRRREK